MYVFVTYKNKEDSNKQGALVFTTFLPLQIYGFFPEPQATNSAVLGRMWPKLELIRNRMVVRVTFKDEEDPIKMKALECSQVFPI